MKFFSRSSRATGPKMRVPRGLRWASMITAAFSSNAIVVPSFAAERLLRAHDDRADDLALLHGALRRGRLDRADDDVADARVAAVVAAHHADAQQLAGAGVVGHLEARFLLDHFATSTIFGEAPVLRLRQRPRLDDADDVADVRRVLLVVGVELHGAPDDLLVLRMRLDHVDLDDDRLVHRARDDDAAPLLAAAAVVLGLRLADDRLPLAGRGGAARARLLRTQRAREPLLLLRLGLRRGRLRASAAGRRLFSGLCRLGAQPAPRPALPRRRLGSWRLLGRRGSSAGASSRSLFRGRGLGLGRVCLRRLCLCLVHWSSFSSAIAQLPSRASRSVTTVRMRAISRFVSFSRALFSSAPVTDWKRRLNSSCRRSDEPVVELVVRQVAKFTRPGQRAQPLSSRSCVCTDSFCSGQAERFLRERLRHAGQLEHHAPAA